MKGRTRGPPRKSGSGPARETFQSCIRLQCFVGWGRDPSLAGHTTKVRAWQTWQVNRVNLWTILAVILAIVIAWWLVGVLFSLIAFVVKLIIVAVVAALVFFAIRGLFAGRARE